MSETDWEALGRRAVACNGWRELGGMLGMDGYRLDEADCDGLHAEAYGWIPDLRNPATLGCLVALVREAWGEPGVFAARAGDCAWIVSHDRWKHRQHAAGGATEAEAWVAALEAAP